METSTTLCSVALADNGRIVAIREANEGYTHSENLHVFIKDVLQEAGVKPADLLAVAVGAGPGSYTGLRIGVSAAKGLAYTLNIPLIAESTLRIMTNDPLISKTEANYYCPMLDARRMEVYCAIYDGSLQEIKPVSAQILDGELPDYFRSEQPVIFFGEGMPKCREHLKQLPGANFIEGIVPSARQLAPLAQASFNEKRFEDVAYFEPFYLKDFQANLKKS